MAGSGGTGKNQGLTGGVHTSVRGKRENLSAKGVFKNRKRIWSKMPSVRRLTGSAEGDDSL
jgi:hypothetical protein